MGQEMAVLKGMKVKAPSPRPADRDKKNDQKTASFSDSLNQAYGQMAAAAPANETAKDKTAQNMAMQNKTESGNDNSDPPPVSAAGERLTSSTQHMRVFYDAAAGSPLGESRPAVAEGFMESAATGHEAFGSAAGGSAAGGEFAAAGSTARQGQIPAAGEKASSLIQKEDGSVKPGSIRSGPGEQRLDTSAFAVLKGIQSETAGKPDSNEQNGEAKGQPESAASQIPQESEKKSETKKSGESSYIQLQEQRGAGNADDQRMIKIKVAEPFHQVNQEFSEKMSDTIGRQMKAGIEQYQIQLEPEHLGRVEVKISVFEGQAVVELSCASHKTAELLNQNAKTIGALMGQHSQSPVSVEVRQSGEPQWHEQQDGQGQGHGHGREQQPDEQAAKHEKERKEGLDFLEQLRLGLYQI